MSQCAHTKNPRRSSPSPLNWSRTVNWPSPRDAQLQRTKPAGRHCEHHAATWSGRALSGLSPIRRCHSDFRTHSRPDQLLSWPLRGFFARCQPARPTIWTLRRALAILFLTHLPAVRLLIQENFHDKRGLVEVAVLRNIALAKRTQPPSMKTPSTKEIRTLCAPQLMHERC